MLGASCDGPDADRCLEGVTVCGGGGTVCAEAPGDNIEACNNVDDDCDGLTDETFDTNWDRDNCGRCGNVCPGAMPYCCSGACYDASVDESNCGGCGACCPSDCSAPGGRFRCCGGACRDLNNCALCCPSASCDACFNALCGC